MLPELEMQDVNKWLDELDKDKSYVVIDGHKIEVRGKSMVDISGRANMKVVMPDGEKKKEHSYMVAYVYGKMQFGSLILKEEFDTNTATAEDLAEFHNRITSEISAYQGEKITVINIVRFN